ncbi:MAG: hypothetical protein KF729_19260 [Sandaracinaceae bacterium]|nr:hypothetical protein [Sandaracinaceae bacterium]
MNWTNEAREGRDGRYGACWRARPGLPLESGIALATAALLASACVNQLPPPAAPPREIAPAIAQQALAITPDEGNGVVVIDVVDGQGTVEDLGIEADGAGRREICPSLPCVAQLSLGEHQFAIHSGGRDDTVTFNVGSRPHVHRRIMSLDTGDHVEYFALALTGLSIGGVFLPIIDPLVRIEPDNIQAHDVGLILAGAFTAAALVTGIVGVILAIIDPRNVREGTSIEWDLAP